MAQTEKGIIYPYDYNEVADVPADLKALAESIDALLNNYSLNTDSGNKIVLEMNNTTYKIKAVLKDKDNNVINTSNEIDLPLESMVTNISYNNQKLILTHQDGQTTEVSIADLISDLASKEEVTELQSQVDDLTTLVETELESNEVEGTEIDVSDSAEYKGRIEVKGNTEQEQLSGKNLLINNVYERTEKGVTITKTEKGEIILNGTATENITIIVSSSDLTNQRKLLLNKEVILNGCPSGGGASTYKLRLYRYDGVNYIDDKGNGTSSVTFTNENDYFNIAIMLYSGVTYNNLVFKPMIRLASVTDDTFEQYCGGQKAPNPSYEIPIKVVTGDNVIKHVGKNLLKYPYNETTVTKNGITFTDKGDGTVLVNGSNSSGATAYYNMQTKSTGSSGIILNPGTYTFDLGIASNVRATINEYDNSNNVIATIPTNQRSKTFIVTEKIKVNAILAVNTNLSVSNVLIKPQIIEGSTPTPYEPSREEEYELSLGTIELCKIGDYSDILFKNVVGDENYNAELEAGVWYKKKAIDKVVLDGSENWGIGTTNVYYTDNILNYAISNNRPYNNYYKGILNVSSAGAMANQDNNTCAFNNDLSNKRFYVKDESKASSTDFKTWISSNNITVYYALNTPIYEQITDPTLISQLEALRKAKWFKGVNHWWTETENLEPVLKGSYKQSNNIKNKQQDERLTNIESRLALLE